MTRPDLHHTLYLPRYLMTWQARPDPGNHDRVEGTLVFADITGFTRLSEDLATRGRIGSEQVSEVLNGAFSELLDVATLDGGDLLSFGGDALLLLYHGAQHVERAAHSAFEMRDALDQFQEVESPSPLAMSVGIASGMIDLFVAGSTSRELIVAGPVVDELVESEEAAEAGEILLASSTAALLEPGVVDLRADDRPILVDAPAPDEHEHDDLDATPPIGFADYLPAPLRKHLTLTFNEGEHRVANVAFVKLSGLGAIIDENGPGEAATALDEWVGGVQGVSERFGVSFLASDLSADGVKLILATGVPERTDAEEDRILRAVGEIGGLSSLFQVTVGVARGNVFSGDIGSPYRRVYTIIGDTVNLAARLAGAASPGDALVTDWILDRATNLFDASRLEPISLKGKSRPIAPYRLGAMIGSGARSGPQFPLIGRDGEMAELLDAAEAARQGHGTAVDLSGPPGIGKTRLLQELTERSGLRAVIAAGEPYETATAFYVAGQILGSALDLPSDKDAEELGKALGEAIQRSAPALVPWAPLVARIAGAQVAMTQEVEDLDDDFESQKTAEVFESLLETVLDEPTLIIVDSAEWTDAASREVLERMLSNVSRRPWLAVISHRPDEAAFPSDLGESQATAEPLQLGGLTPNATRALLGHVVGKAELAVPILDEVAERSGGTPFFLIALARGLAEGAEDLPESIEAAAAARIDRLDLRDRRMLRYASALGRKFTVDMLVDTASELAPIVEDREVWDRLGEFLEVTAAGTVRFRQPIIRDVAYAGLAFGKRVELHAAIGAALERRARRRPERYAEQLSFHFSEAGDDAKTWEYGVMAGDRARRKHANVVAVEHYRRALLAGNNLLGEVAATDVAEAAEALGDAAERAGLLDQAWEAYDEAMTLGRDDGLGLGRRLRKKAIVKELTGDYDAALELLDRCLDQLGALDLSEAGQREQLDAALLYAGVLNRKGDNQASVDLCLQVLGKAGEVGYEAAIAHASNLLETNYTDLNHPDRGSAYGKALEIYRSLGDLVGEAKVLNNLGYNAYFLGDWSAAAEHWEGSAAASSRAGDIVTAAMVMNNLAEIDIDRGRLEAARPPLEEALRIWRGARYPLGVAFVHANLGRVEGRSGQTERAEEHFDAAEATFSDVGSKPGVLDVRMRRLEAWLVHAEWQRALPVIEATLAEADALAGSTVLRAGLHRLRGLALLQASRPDPAREALETSLALAVEAQARFEEGLTLHALSTWAAGSGEEDLWGDQARRILDDLGVITPPPIAPPLRPAE